MEATPELQPPDADVTKPPLQAASVSLVRDMLASVLGRDI